MSQCLGPHPVTFGWLALHSSHQGQSTQNFISTKKRKQFSCRIPINVQTWMLHMLFFQCLLSILITRIDSTRVQRCACICPEPHSLLTFDDMLYYDGMEDTRSLTLSPLPHTVQQRLVYLDVNVTDKNECNCEQQMLPRLIKQTGNPLPKMMANADFCQLCQCDLNPHSHMKEVHYLLNKTVVNKRPYSETDRMASSSVMIKIGDKKVRNRRAATARPERLWEHGVIPYEIQANFSGKNLFKPNFSSAQISAISF